MIINNYVQSVIIQILNQNKLYLQIIKTIITLIINSANKQLYVTTDLKRLSKCKHYKNKVKKFLKKIKN
jgi:hypothetical protein